jgi:hypothetical protein
MVATLLAGLEGSELREVMYEAMLVVCKSRKSRTYGCSCRGCWRNSKYSATGLFILSTRCKRCVGLAMKRRRHCSRSPRVRIGAVNGDLYIAGEETGYIACERYCSLEADARCYVDS